MGTHGVAVNGAPLGATRLTLADVIRDVKSNSTGWIHEKWPNRSDFGWQVGYAAFGVSESNCGAVRRYIANQETHHRRITFKEELVLLLKKHNIQYDERYLWD